MIFSAKSVSITKPELRALVAHSSADTTHPHVNAVFFDAADLRAAATDGHRLAILTGDGDKGAWTYLLPRDAAETALRAKGAETFILSAVSCDVVAFNKDNRKVGTFEAAQPKRPDTTDKAGAVVPGKVLDFPPYQQTAFTPADGGNRTRQGFDAGYLADVALAATAANSPNLGVVFYPGGSELDPGVFTVGGWVIYVMPMRLGNDVSATAPKPVKGQRAAQDAPSGAIVLAGGPVVLAAPEASQNGKPAAVIVLHTTPVNAASLGSDLAPVALLAARKSRVRQYRETFGTTADDYRADVVQAWIDAAPAEDAAPVDRCPWG